jgi:RNA polymerase sigma-70 factor (ECF subfamily)
MTPEPDDRLLEQVARGEDGAAEELFTAYSPYLRAIVRRRLSGRLRAKFDSADVVQSVWVQVVRRLQGDGWRVGSEAELRALLATIARRRLTDRARRHARSVAAEHPGRGDLDALPSVGQPRPSEVAQAGDLWDRLLGLCPPEHREVLRLRREGFLLAEIAARTGLHEGSVRRILRNLSRDLALHDRPLPPGAGPTEP